MAAPDRVYRYFTNLKAKIYGSNDLFYIRGAKPLGSYVTQTGNPTYLQQEEELKQKFKVDGILWLKNPEQPSSNQVTIEDPANAGQTIQIDDPDYGDTNRDAFIAYVYPSGANAAFHDIDTTSKSGSYSATDFTLRTWSRASKFRYKKYEDSEAAIILNDGGLNRRGNVKINSNNITAYIYNAQNQGTPRFNDVKIPVGFWSTPYNRIQHTYLYGGQSASAITTLIGDGGTIPKLGPGVTASMEAQTPIEGAVTETTVVNSATRKIKFIGRENPNITETDYTSILDFSALANNIVITTSAVNMDSPINVTVPNFYFKAVCVNEEGQVSDATTSPVQFGLYRWNMDDTLYPRSSSNSAANNAPTDRISISYASPETSIDRYNNRYAVTHNQMTYSPGEADPSPSSPNAGNVELLYTRTDNFLTDVHIFNNQETGSVNTLQFFINESGSGQFTYMPLTTWYLMGNPNPPSEISYTYLTMRCKVDNEEGVYCFQYRSNPLNDNWMVITKCWKLTYNGTQWIYDGASEGANVRINVRILDSNNNSVTMLEANTCYTIEVSLNGYPANKNYKVDFSTSTSGIAAFTTDNGATTSSTASSGWITNGPANPTFTNVKLKRLSSTPDAKSSITVTVTYLAYVDMLDPNHNTSENFPVVTYGYSSLISGFLLFNYKSGYTTYVDGASASPADILANPSSHTQLNGGNDVTYYIRASDGVLCTDSGLQVQVSQGYYLVNYNVSSGTCDDIYYVDSSGIPALVEK